MSGDMEQLLLTKIEEMQKELSDLRVGVGKIDARMEERCRAEEEKINRQSGKIAKLFNALEVVTVKVNKIENRLTFYGGGFAILFFILQYGDKIVGFFK